jgi:excisionase family DNA binding protein
MTGLSERTVVRLYQRGEWPSLKVGTRRLIVVRGVERWIADKAS